MIHNSISFVFFGTDDFSVIVLDELKKAGLLPALVITQPDRPKGRGLTLTPPPAKEWARENGIECLQPEVLDSSFHYTLHAKRYTLFVVASYGLILPRHILDIPKHGTLNVHPSLLPKYRGATPLESQILNDEKEVGVTIMLMDEKMDHGPIVSCYQLPTTHYQLQPKASELRKTLAREGGKLLARTIPRWIAGEIKAVPQDDSQATYTRKFAKEDGLIDLAGDAKQNFLKIQAFVGSIGTYFFASPPFQGGDRRGGHTEDSTTPPSAPLPRTGGVEKGIRVVIKQAEFRDGTLRILRVVPEWKKEMSYADFLRGLK